MKRRGTSNANVRGSATQRRARKLWLLDPASGWLGNGTTVPCAFPHCPELLTLATITVDRWVTPGCQGGGYRRENIRPACATHNYGEGYAIAQARQQVAG